MEPGSWFNAFVWKPLYVLQAMIKGIPWKYRARYSVTEPRVFSFVKALRTSLPPFETNNLKIGAAGFCWGGRHTLLLAADTPSSRVYRHESQVNSSALEPLIDCAFTAHPSSVEVPKDIDAVTIPTSVAVGENDMAMGAPLIQQMKNIFENKKVGEHEVVIIPGAKVSLIPYNSAILCFEYSKLWSFVGVCICIIVFRAWLLSCEAPW